MGSTKAELFNENHRLRKALARLQTATDPYVEEAAEHETMSGLWFRYWQELCGARQQADDALGGEHRAAA